MIIEKIGRILLASMFVMSVIKNLTGGFKGSVEYVKKTNIPLPELLVIAAMIIKGFGSYSLITGKMEKIALPLLIGFLIIVTILFNNPIKNPEKKWMCMSLLGVLGGLLIVYDKSI